MCIYNLLLYLFQFFSFDNRHLCLLFLFIRKCLNNRAGTEYFNQMLHLCVVFFCVLAREGEAN